MTFAANSGRAERASTASVLWRLLVPVLLLALTAALVLGSSKASSSTFDEPYHLGAGYAYLRTGDARLFSDHPPLVDTWLSLPLLLLDLDLPLEIAAWQQGEYGSFGDVFLWQANPDQALKAVWMARLPNAALALLLGASVYAWTRSMVGLLAAFLALAAFALDPGIIANAGLATNDLGVAAALFIASWAWWRWLECPSEGRLLTSGVLAGVACASKYTGLVVAPAFLLTALVHRPGTEHGAPRWRERGLGLVAAGAICIIVVWAAYGFDVERGVPAPAYWQGLLFQGDRLVHGQPVYALGRVWPHGVWFYYPLALALKTPLPVMILVAAAAYTAIRRRVARTLLIYGLPALTVLAATQLSDLQLGHRYLLPALPFAFGLVGFVVRGIEWPLRDCFRGKVRLAVVGLLLLWLLINVVAIHPQELSFFNELAGGAAKADRYLVDANLDWGQGLLYLRDTMAERDIPFVHLGYFGSAVPDLYGISYWAAPGFLRFVNDPESMAFNPYSPDPGWYAISRTSLRQGLSLTDPDIYAYFRSLPLEGRAGYSVDLYQVKYAPGTLAARVVVQGERVASLNADALGSRGGERLFAKWVSDNNSFVLAMNGPARYFVADPLPFAPDLRMALAENATALEGAVWEVNAKPAVLGALEDWRATSSLWAPNSVNAFAPPLEYDGGLSLAGYRLDSERVRAGDDVGLSVLWRVSGGVRPPVAMFVHLLAADGSVLTQYDGWGTAIRGLEVGDIVVLHVRLAVAQDTPPGAHRLQIGLYSPDTMARWTVLTPAGESVDRLWLPEVEVH